MNIYRNPVILSAAIFISLLYGQHAIAQWNNNPTLNTPVCTTAGTHQFQPQLTPDGSGGVYIAWMETPDFNSSQIYAQHLSANGTRLWPTAGIPITAVPGLYSQVQIITGSDGAAVISWINTANAMIRHYMQKITPAGQLQWNSNGIAVCPSQLTQMFYYQLVTDGNGGAILLWDDQRNGPNEVFAQRIGADGTAKWIVAGVSCSPPFTNYSSYDAVADSSGGMMLCWTRTTGLSTRNDVFVQHINGTGLPQWGGGGINICSAVSDQLYCKIARDARHNIIVSWQDFRLDPVRSQFYAQRISAAGNLLWNAGGILLADSVVAASTVSKLATDTSGGIQLAWIDKFLPLPSQTAHLMALRADSMGNITSLKKEIASWPDLQMPVDFEFVPDFLGGAYISWAQPYVSNPTGSAYEIYDIYAQHLRADGSTEFPLSGRAVSTAPMSQLYQQMICDSNAVAVLAWADIRNGADYDLYAAALTVQNALPVTWLTFSGKVVGSAVSLKWETINEINNRGFIIQRSADGTHFSNIGFTPAANSTVHPSYSYIDSQPLQGNGFYRLSQLDVDGKTAYSPTIKVNIDLNHKLTLYPNPASDQILVQGDIAHSLISVYTLYGQKIREIRSGALNSINIDISTLVTGSYIVVVKNDTHAGVKQAAFLKK